MPPPNFYYFRGMPIWLILLRETAKALRTLLFHLTPIPSLWRARRYASWVGGWRSIPGLAFVSAVDDFARVGGGFKALRELFGVVGMSNPPAAAPIRMP